MPPLRVYTRDLRFDDGDVRGIELDQRLYCDLCTVLARRTSGLDRFTLFAGDDADGTGLFGDMVYNYLEENEYEESDHDREQCCHYYEYDHEICENGEYYQYGKYYDEDCHEYYDIQLYDVYRENLCTDEDETYVAFSYFDGIISDLQRTKSDGYSLSFIR